MINIETLLIKMPNIYVKYNNIFECRDIWTRFLDFESNVGDLSSIIKVEKRRGHVLAVVNQ